ncbi:MAG: Nif11-like leader peptide family natural product precursor [Calothrix sp. FI2-JRJ7]|jgi:predicted ribosomally synthesized peptide with nif11-like leader|nr:Nif11-like leader peptide family natural product precursor [Calothrix sp. FI2-JRJ7]
MSTISLNQVQPTTSLTNLEQFFQEVLSNPALQMQIQAVTDLESLSQLAVKLGKEYGYYFTTEEVQAAAAVETAIGSLWRTEDELKVKSIDFEVPSGTCSFSDTCCSCNHN